MALQKRSMRINGHRTSVALEPEFWAAAERQVKALSTTLPRYFAEIDGARADDVSLAGAIRVALLNQSDRAAA